MRACGMDTATASRRRQALDDALDTQRALNSVEKRSRRIFRKPQVAQPSALDQIKANGPMAKMGRAFNESRAGAQRSANVANAKKNGTFDVIREKYNRENLGKASMSDAGDIAGPNSPAPAVAATPKAKPAAAPIQKADMFPSRARGLRDETGDVTAKIRAGIGLLKPAPAPDPTSASGSVGDLVKQIDYAIARNKGATETMRKVFSRNKA